MLRRGEKYIWSGKRKEKEREIKGGIYNSGRMGGEVAKECELSTSLHTNKTSRWGPC
jgi:hypothetical protein